MTRGKANEIVLGWFNRRCVFWPPLDPQRLAGVGDLAIYTLNGAGMRQLLRSRLANRILLPLDAAGQRL